MIIQARRIEALQTTLTKAEWLALISAASSFASAVVNSVS